LRATSRRTGWREALVGLGVVQPVGDFLLAIEVVEVVARRCAAVVKPAERGFLVAAVF
jgi:hypothetical protein